MGSVELEVWLRYGEIDAVRVEGVLVYGLEDPHSPMPLHRVLLDRSALVCALGLDGPDLSGRP